jgi:hypothetical protein
MGQGQGRYQEQALQEQNPMRCGFLMRFSRFARPREAESPEVW